MLVFFQVLEGKWYCCYNYFITLQCPTVRGYTISVLVQELDHTIKIKYTGIRLTQQYKTWHSCSSRNQNHLSTCLPCTSRVGGLIHNLYLKSLQDFPKLWWLPAQSKGMPCRLNGISKLYIVCERHFVSCNGWHPIQEVLHLVPWVSSDNIACDHA